MSCGSPGGGAAALDEGAAGLVVDEEDALEAAGVGLSGFSALGGCLPRLSAGRFGSAGSEESSGVEAGVDAAVACWGVLDGGLGGVGAEATAVEVGVEPDAGADPAAGDVDDAVGAVVGVGELLVSGGVGLLAEECCNNTGGPESSFNPRGWMGAGFFAALAASDAAVSNLPSATHALVSLFCSTPDTVNRPCEMPVFCASYTVSAHNAIGTGDALYADAS